jgi:Transcriptional regulators containing an AAA-type ATPase domain and a DNA-binding domain
MYKEVQKLIENENKKQPLTDEELAKLLNISRDKVKDLREKNRIPNSRDRLRPYIYSDAKKIFETNPGLSHRKLLDELNGLGYDISRHVALKLMQELTENRAKEPEKDESPINDTKHDTSQSAKHDTSHNVKHDTKHGVKNDRSQGISQHASNNTAMSLDDEEDVQDEAGGMQAPFQQVVGYDGSLKLQIRQAQAATLYPPKGLHTLIIGPSGVGKSQLAESMHKFAVQTGNFSPDSPFVTFNCADYAENPQLLLSQLFGYMKGAFTGAEKEKSGIIELANGGILFLDEIHRLPSEGQEILFSILDRGVYKKLGETESSRKASLMIIGATTENPESALLLTFRRRIPMVIELPPLSKRLLSERFRLIKLFFKSEAVKINKDIVLDKDVISMLLQYECPGNIGQLKSDIQVSCARGLLNTMIEKSDILQIKISDLANHVRIDMLNKRTRDPEVLKYTEKNLRFGANDSVVGQEQDDRYVLSDRIYQFIEERLKKLEREGLNPEELNLVMGREIETEFENLAKHFNYRTDITKLELKNLVGANITRTIERCFNIARNFYPELQRNFYYTLAIHMGATYERIVQGKIILNPHMDRIREDYPNEFKVAAILAEVINTDLEIKLPESEIGFIAMYIKTFLDKRPEKLAKVGVVVLTHGKVGKAMAEVANKLLNTNHAAGLEMSLTESPKKALEKTVAEIKRVDEGKGCVLLVDMGSLTTFGDIITKETGIAVRVIDRVDTVMVLEVIRRAIISDSTLEDVVASVSKETIRNETVRINQYDYSGKPNAIVTICITGEGSAEKMRGYVENVVKKLKKDIEVFPVGVISPIDIDIEIQRIMNKYNILCFVGTINPEYSGIPFISMESILGDDGLNRLNQIIYGIQSNDNDIREIIHDDLILMDVEFKDKNDALDHMVKLLQNKGYVDEEFLLGVYKREAIAPTFLKGNVAIPHGYPQNVIIPVAMIAKLKNPIDWHENRKIDIIFLIAYKNNSKKYFKDFYKEIMNAEVLEMIRNAETKEEIRRLVLNHI